MAITYNNLYLDLRAELRRAGDEEATQSARELVCAAAGKTREELVLSVSYTHLDVYKRQAQKRGFDPALAAAKARGQLLDRLAVKVAKNEHTAHLLACLLYTSITSG